MDLFLVVTLVCWLPYFRCLRHPKKIPVRLLQSKMKSPFVDSDVVSVAAAVHLLGMSFEKTTAVAIASSRETRFRSRRSMTGKLFCCQRSPKCMKSGEPRCDCPHIFAIMSSGIA
jgi:hypothetical protein